MCKKRLFTRYLHYIYKGHAGTIVTPCLDKIQGSKKHFGTWLHPTELHSWEDKLFKPQASKLTFRESEEWIIYLFI